MLHLFLYEKVSFSLLEGDQSNTKVKDNNTNQISLLIPIFSLREENNSNDSTGPLMAILHRNAG